MDTDLELNKSPKIFISHSSNDAEIALALVKLLEFLGIKDIFCSSVAGYGIPVGEDIYQSIKHEYEEHELFMIYLISPEYLHSYMSLNEMGAAWILKNNYLTFILSSLTEKSLDGTCIGKNNIAIIWNDKDIMARMNEFKDKMIEQFCLLPPNPNRWEDERNVFVRNLNSYQSVPKEEEKIEIPTNKKTHNQPNDQNELVHNLSVCIRSKETIIAEMYQQLFLFVKDQLEIETIRLGISHKGEINSSSAVVEKAWIDGYRVIRSMNTLLSQNSDKVKLLIQAKAIGAFVYYNMAMLWGHIPLVKSAEIGEIMKTLQSETDAIYHYCLDLLSECSSISDLNNRHVNDSFVNILYAELYTTLGQKDLAYSYLKKLTSFNDSIFTLNGVDKNGTQSIIDIYTQKYVELLKEEVEGKDNSKAWFDRGAVYGTWAALKRLGKAQSLTGVNDYELLLPIALNEIHCNNYIKQNSGY